jgi:hypothetical protein
LQFFSFCVVFQIFDEILVNAADNKQRDPNMKLISVTIDFKHGWVSVKNDGQGIPIEIHPKHGIYVPELIFGNLLTSSNYNVTIVSHQQNKLLMSLMFASINLFLRKLLFHSRLKSN